MINSLREIKRRLKILAKSMRRAISRFTTGWDLVVLIINDIDWISVLLSMLLTNFHCNCYLKDVGYLESSAKKRADNEPEQRFKLERWPSHGNTVFWDYKIILHKVGLSAMDSFLQMAHYWRYSLNIWSDPLATNIIWDQPLPIWHYVCWIENNIYEKVFTLPSCICISFTAKLVYFAKVNTADMNVLLYSSTLSKNTVASMER